MRTKTLLRTAFLAVTLGIPAVAAGQTPAGVNRGDATALISWQGVRKGTDDNFQRERWHSSLFGGVAAGWFWTDNLKTEIDFGAGTEADGYRSEQVIIQGHSVWRFTRFEFTRQTAGISQQYQFFRNQWFHPHVGVGVHVVRERTTRIIDPVVVFDQVTPGGRQIQPGQSLGPTIDVFLAPFVSTGFKAYLTRQAFFRSDLRLAFRRGVDEAQLRAGFGFDF